MPTLQPNAPSVVLNYMRRAAWTPLVRFLLALGMFGIAIVASFTLATFLESFQNTSYRFVSLFLVVIFASNVLAQMAREYRNA